MNTIKAPHAPVRSRVVDTIYTPKRVWNRQDSINACNERRAIKEMVAAQREKVTKTVQKTANVRKKKNCYHVIGHGELTMTKTELYTYLRANSYVRVRMGGLVFGI